MNTPRSKRPKRHTLVIQNIPDGQWIPGIQNPDMAAAVGYFITAWPHTEELMAELFHELTGISTREDARLVFRSIINQNIRLTVMRAMLERSPRNQAKGPEFEEMIDEFSAINGTRNKYAHGIWHTHGNTGAFYIQEETDTWGSMLVFGPRRVIEQKEVEGWINRMNALSRRLIDHNLKPHLASSQIPSPLPSGDN